MIYDIIEKMRTLLTSEIGKAMKEVKYSSGVKYHYSNNRPEQTYWLCQLFSTNSDGPTSFTDFRNKQLKTNFKSGFCHAKNLWDDDHWNVEKFNNFMDAINGEKKKDLILALNAIEGVEIKEISDIPKLFRQEYKKLELKKDKGNKNKQNTMLSEISQKGFVIKAGSLIKYEGGDSDVVIPDNVIAIDDGAFEDQKGIISVIIPSCVKYIGKSAFKNCINLQNITCHASEINKISDEVFYNCQNLSEFTLPYDCTEIGERAFANCTKLKEIKGRYKLVKIGKEAFEECSSLETIEAFNVEIRPSSIKEGAFIECYHAKPVIEEKAFYKCKELKIDPRWFQVSHALTLQPALPDLHFLLPPGLYYTCQAIIIKSYAFYGCSSLQKIYLDEDTTVEEYAFAECWGLKSIVFTGDTTIKDGAFYNCINLEECKFEYPDSSLKLELTESEFFHDYEILTSNDAFFNTPLLEKRKKLFKSHKCLFCGGNTKRIFGFQSLLHRKCIECGEDIHYERDFILSSDVEYIKNITKND